MVQYGVELNNKQLPSVHGFPTFFRGESDELYLLLEAK